MYLDRSFPLENKGFSDVPANNMGVGREDREKIQQEILAAFREAWSEHYAGRPETSETQWTPEREIMVKDMLQKYPYLCDHWQHDTLKSGVIPFISHEMDEMGKQEHAHHKEELAA